MKRILLMALLTLSTFAHAIVLRHDVDDSAYRVDEQKLPALVDLPAEGHGVLIAPGWVLTAAHATQWHSITEVSIAGKCRPVKQIIVHPGYKRLEQDELRGDAAPVMAFLLGSDDIALIELSHPVDGVVPIPLFRGRNELGKLAKIYGKGATGTGVAGPDPGGPNRTVLRRAFNRITIASDRWLGYKFDEGSSGHPLEGMLGNGDSGGPLLIEVDGEWQLAGLASWKYWTGRIEHPQLGVYGQTAYNARVSSYSQWIAETMHACGADRCP